MNFEQLSKTIIDDLERHLNSTLPNHPIAEVYRYAVLPPGKVFRPLLVWSIQNDLSKKELVANSINHSLFSSFVEIHHSYTLVHDDLPCMDNDMERRGKPSTHAKYGEWKALLTGDGLLNASYRLLSKINSASMPILLKYCTWCLGPKGLIQGQVLDLSEEMTLSFENLILTHQNKTARLMQAALVGSYLIIDNKKETQYSQWRTCLDLFKLGHSIGVIFQLLDDLTELVDDTLTEHEQSVNPWPKMKEECKAELISELERTDSLINKHELANLSSTLSLYFQKIIKNLDSGKNNVEKHSGMNLMPVMSLLNAVCGHN